MNDKRILISITMKKIKYIMPLLFLCQLYAAEDNLLVSEQLDDGIPSEYEPCLLYTSPSPRD